MWKEQDQKNWERCADFHGHTCGGLAIGFQAARRAAQLLGLTFSQDEEVVCVCENDACGVDAIQVLLGCSVGKGNLLFRMRGKQAFSFFCRKTGQSVRYFVPCRICPGRNGVTGSSARILRIFLSRSRWISRCPNRRACLHPTPVTAAGR